MGGRGVEGVNSNAKGFADKFGIEIIREGGQRGSYDLVCCIRSLYFFSIHLTLIQTDDQGRNDCSHTGYATSQMN